MTGKKIKIKVVKKAKKSTASDVTEVKQKSKHAGTNNLINFKPGQSGNPKGRPKGSRAKFGEAFVTDFLKAWEEGGLVAIKRVRKDDPSTFLRVAASILPKELNVGDSNNKTLEDFLDKFKTVEEIDEFIRGINAIGTSPSTEEAETEAEA